METNEVEQEFEDDLDELDVVLEGLEINHLITILYFFIYFSMLNIAQL
jgi:hypothetical protein